MSDKKQAKNPEIRFKQEDGTDYPDWEKQKWGTLTQQVIVRAGKDSSYPVYSVSNSDGFIPQTEQFSDREVASADRANYKVVAPCQFAYNPSRINVGSIAYLRGTERVIVSPLYIVFACNDGELDEAFLDLYVRTHSFHRQRQANTAGSVRDSLSYDGFAEINLPIPSLDEQQRIASLFAQLDALVSATQDEVDGLKELKRTLLKQIFDQTIRFVKEDGTEYAKWENKKLSQITDFIRNGFTYRPDGNRNHMYKVTRIETISSGFINPLRLGSTDDSIPERFKLMDGDILFSHINSIQYLGKTALYISSLGEIYHGMNLLCLRPKTAEIMPYILLLILRTPKTAKWIYMNAKRAINQCSIPASDIGNMKVILPVDPEEQARIAILFESLDEAIHEAETELTKYQELKKALMQKMFV